MKRYKRYHIETEKAPDIERWPSRFKVKVGKICLARLIAKELVQYRGDLEVVFSRPCVYGVFSGPLGGLKPREHLCVGCLRCTTEQPSFVRVFPNTERQKLGDSYFHSSYVEAVLYEAATGRIPVKGAGYRGRFAGDGWDSMWTDMSEIVRPTRDGIHGREFISTVVDIGERPAFLEFDRSGRPVGTMPRAISVPLPLLFDRPPKKAASEILDSILSQAAAEIASLAIMPLKRLLNSGIQGEHLVPLISSEDVEHLEQLTFQPRMLAIDGWIKDLYDSVSDRFDGAPICVRVPYTSGRALLEMVEKGVRIFHFAADFHGRGPNGDFAFSLIRAAHGTLVDAGCRDQVTLLGSGGIIAAEHVPKAIIAGLDAVALDTPLLIALQARFEGDFLESGSGRCQFPNDLSVEWGVQRLKNLTWAWRDQLLEVLGAMGLREVRRLRGEMGRALFHKELEREAFSGIPGYGEQAAEPSLGDETAGIPGTITAAAAMSREL